MFHQFGQLPDYRLDILDKRSGKVISTGYFSAKQEEQIGEMIRGLNREVMSYRMYGILHEFEDKSEFGEWLAENTTLPMDPGI
ncbi:MAG TPA: hypothetical protein VM008_22535 [Phycisphaerae bacterium]|nr:hypothetical protein [Phycisphaerae bacterium]